MEEINRLMELCRRAIDGNIEAQHELDLQSVSVEMPRNKNLSEITLQHNFTVALTLATAARKLKRTMLESQCLQTIQYISSIAASRKLNLDDEIDGQDVAEVMLSILDEVKSWICPLDTQDKKDPSSESEEENIHSAGPSQPATSAEKAPLAEAALPSDSAASAKPPMPDMSTAPATSTRRPLSPELPVQATKTKPGMPAVQVIPATPAEPDEVETMSQNPEKQAYASNSHNKRRQCPHCPFFGTHLARHMTLRHVDDLSQKEIAVLVADIDQSIKVKTFNHNSQRYQCGIKGCNQVVTRKAQHSRRYHKIVDKETVRRASTQFRKLTSTCTKRSSTSKPPSQPKSKKRRVSKKAFPPKPKSPEDARKTQTTTLPSRKPSKESGSSDESDDSASSFKPDDESDSDGGRVDPGYLDIEADLDEISEYAETDEEELALEDNPSWRDYHLSGDKKTTRQHFVSAFFRYLLHIEGGGHSIEQSLIHARQVHSLMDDIDEKGTDLACLVRNDGMDIWGKFLGPKLKNKILKGNTIKTYITSLEYFVRFIEKGFFYKKELLPDTHRAAILSLKIRLPDYCSCVHRRTANQTTTRKVDQAFTKMTPADLRELRESNVVKEAIKLLGMAATEQKIPTRNDFTNIRDYLLVTALYENGSRPSPLENMTVKRFKQAQQTSNGRWVVLVDEHKTSRHYGPAELVFDDHLYHSLKIFVNYIRPAYAPHDEVDAVFIKEDGHQFPKGTIGRRVKEFFKRAGIRVDISVSATRIRQIHSTGASGMSPKKRKVVASHMKHKLSTADRNYVIELNVEKAGRAHELMGKIISGESATKEVEADSNDIFDSKKEEADSNDIIDSKKKQDISLEKEKEQDYSSDEEEKQAEFSTSLSNEEKSVLMTVFMDDINAGRVLTVAEIRFRMRSVPFLRRFVLDQPKTKKFYDFVRYKTTVVRQTSDTFEGVDEFEFVSSLSSSQRKPWEAHDTYNIEQAFSSWKSMPNKHQVIDTFQSDSVLRHIISREGKNRCYEKVKALFKKRADK